MTERLWRQIFQIHRSNWNLCAHICSGQGHHVRRFQLRKYVVVYVCLTASEWLRMWHVSMSVRVQYFDPAGKVGFRIIVSIDDVSSEWDFTFAHPVSTASSGLHHVRLPYRILRGSCATVMLYGYWRAPLSFSREVIGTYRVFALIGRLLLTTDT